MVFTHNMLFVCYQFNFDALSYPAQGAIGGGPVAPPPQR